MQAPLHTYTVLYHYHPYSMHGPTYVHTVHTVIIAMHLRTYVCMCLDIVYLTKNECRFILGNVATYVSSPTISLSTYPTNKSSSRDVQEGYYCLQAYVGRTFL